MVCGGGHDGKCEAWDHGRGEWQPLPAMQRNRAFAPVAVAPLWDASGRLWPAVVVAGGLAGGRVSQHPPHTVVPGRAGPPSSGSTLTAVGHCTHRCCAPPRPSTRRSRTRSAPGAPCASRRCRARSPPPRSAWLRRAAGWRRPPTRSRRSTYLDAIRIDSVRLVGTKFSMYMYSQVPLYAVARWARQRPARHIKTHCIFTCGHIDGTFCGKLHKPSASFPVFCHGTPR